MSEPYVQINTMQYTEAVFYDAEGREVGRDRIWDDYWYDTVETRPMTDDEREEWLADE